MFFEYLGRIAFSLKLHMI